MKIIVNGREYSSPDELPAEARAGYERAMSALADRNGNGIPDILEMQLDPASLGDRDERCKPRDNGYYRPEVCH